MNVVMKQTKEQQQSERNEADAPMPTGTSSADADAAMVGEVAEKTSDDAGVAEVSGVPSEAALEAAPDAREDDSMKAAEPTASSPADDGADVVDMTESEAAAGIVPAPSDATDESPADDGTDAGEAKVAADAGSPAGQTKTDGGTANDAAAPGMVVETRTESENEEDAPEPAAMDVGTDDADASEAVDAGDHPSAGRTDVTVSDGANDTNDNDTNDNDTAATESDSASSGAGAADDAESDATDVAEGEEAAKGQAQSEGQPSHDEARAAAAATVSEAHRRGPVPALRRWLSVGDARTRRRKRIGSTAVAAVLAVALVVALAVAYNAFVRLPVEIAQAKALQSQLEQEYGFDPGSIISDDEFFDGDALDADGVQAVLNKIGAKCEGKECLRNYTETVESIPADDLCDGYPVTKADKNYKAASKSSGSSSKSSDAASSDASSSKQPADASKSSKSGAAQSNASKSAQSSGSSNDSADVGTSKQSSTASGQSGASSTGASDKSSAASSGQSDGSSDVKPADKEGSSSAQSSSRSDSTTDATATHSAAQIIANAGKSCGISQKVLLVMLEKEQGLVSATKPTQAAYDAALGLSCPDGAACDTKYRGFFKQVYGAAERFRYYLGHEELYGYYADRLNYVAFNPDKSCGGRNVWIENDATALLYIYTPYQPNDAALAAGAGEGDECSTYGNRNFSLLYGGWFG